MDLQAWGREESWASLVPENARPLCLSRPWWRSHPLPSFSLTSLSLTAESPPQVPPALHFMTVWATLALLSLFTLPWELSSGAYSFLLLREQFYWIGEQSCCPNPLAPGWRLSAEKVLFCLISWVREMGQVRAEASGMRIIFPPSSCHGAWLPILS